VKPVKTSLFRKSLNKFSCSIFFHIFAAKTNWLLVTLRDIETGQTVLVKRILGRSSFRRRITEMGFVQGKEVQVVKNAPLRDPIEYRIMGYNISLRRSEAALIEVVMPDESEKLKPEYFGTLEFEKANRTYKKGRKNIEVFFVGNPNAGKTSLYNAITGRQEHVGNYSGVTVDAKQAKIHRDGYNINVTDLPGTYSLSPNSPDEIFVRDHILKKHPDVVVNVIDASNIERNLYLTCQLIDMDIQVVLALNMYDELEKTGDKFNLKQFAKITGIPVVPTIGTKRTGINELIEKVIEVAENKEPSQRHIHINYGDEIEQSINAIQKKIWKASNYVREFSSRYIALRLLEKDDHTRESISYLDNSVEIIETSNHETRRLENLLNDDSQTLITNARFGFITGSLKETLKHSSIKEKQSASEKIDQILTGKYTGFPLFLLALWVMFQGTFVLGHYPADWIDWMFHQLGFLMGNLIPTGPARDLIVDGVIGGVGGVLVFLPNIVILFFFISVMEDTGYMARVAFIMDKLMHLIGLHGKSFIPLIMGFGCNVPAIMSTRTLQNRSDRLLTMLIIPFMSCSARLPVYILIAGAIFPKNAGTVIFLIYISGIIISILTALLLKSTMFRAKEAPFVMELPPYRIPTVRSTVRHMWGKAGEYIKKMGSVILWASVAVWFLSYFPRTNETIKTYENQLIEINSQIKDIQSTSDISRADFTADTLFVQSKALQRKIHEEQQYNSYIGKLGRTVEPVLRPIGFDWKIGVSLLSGVIAKEIVVSTLGVLYAGDNTDNEQTLREALQQQTYKSGKLKGEKIYSKPTTLALLVFVLIYIPCIAVIAAIRRESGKWKWALFNITYATTLAWIIAFIVSKAARLFF
jgi:ferrous iron transport protein B